MKRTRLTHSFMGLALAIGMLAVTVQEANAGWFWNSARHGSSGSWGSSGSSGGWHSPRVRRHHSSGSWGSRGIWGPGGSSGSWGSWGSSGSSGSWGSWGSSGSSGGSIRYYESSPSMRVEKSEAPATPPPADQTSRQDIPADASILNVSVPTDAKIFVNGKATTTPGTERQFVSRNLKPGSQYTYRVRAEVERDGKRLAETKVVDLRSGHATRIAFDFQTAVVKQPKTVTRLTVRLPADAKLFISGSETESTGPVRTFTTQRLTGDQSWEDYTIRVVATRDGRPIVEEKTIELRAGDSRDLTFDFDTSQVATVGNKSTR